MLTPWPGRIGFLGSARQLSFLNKMAREAGAGSRFRQRVRDCQGNKNGELLERERSARRGQDVGFASEDARAVEQWSAMLSG